MQNFSTLFPKKEGYRTGSTFFAFQTQFIVKFLQLFVSNLIDHFIIYNKICGKFRDFIIYNYSCGKNAQTEGSINGAIKDLNKRINKRIEEERENY